MKKIFAVMFIILILTGSVTAYGAAPDTKATSVILATLDGTQIVYSKNPDEKLPPAEFTKLMSAYTAFKIYGSDTAITVPDNISEYTNTMETNMTLKPGENIPVSSLIYGMIMGQANDAALAIALYYGGIDEFAGRMNGYAKELGMENTSFVNPTGNNDSSQYTTASDMLKLYRTFYKSKELYGYLSQKSVVLPATDLSRERTYWTKNHLMSRFIYLEYIYEYANAGLSSSSSHGGYSVISSASKGTKNLVCIVMDSAYENGVNYSMIDAKEMFDYGFDEFTTVTIAKQGDLLYEAELKNYKGKDTLLLDAEQTLKGLILDTDAEENGNDLSKIIEKEVIIDEPVEAPVEKGSVVGKIVYKYQGNAVGEINLIAEKDVKRGILRTVLSGVKWFFSLGAVKFILLLILCIVALFAALIVNTLNKDKKNRRKR